MIITKKRIKSIKPFSKIIKKGARFFIGVKDPQRFKEILNKIGFTEALEPGELILPSSLGPISRYNAEGKFIVHKDQPIEIAYRTVEWHWKEWHGPYDRVERSKFVDVPYKRYPRTFISPPSVELILYLTSKGESILVGPIIKYNRANEQHIIHVINLFLEIFGECQFFTKDLDEIIKLPIKRLNWRILPPGQRPWPQLKKEIQPLIKAAPKGNQPVMEYRLKTINKRKPDFAALGEGGFKGYIVLGFSKKNIFTFESLYYGNATYIFDERWEELSKKTKAEILNEDLQTDRIIHRKSWGSKIRKWLSK